MNTKLHCLFISVCFFFASCGVTSEELQPTITATFEIPTSSPTPSETPTPTHTPKPTVTFTPSPTVTPGPMWHTQFGDFPHAINDKGQETYNFKLDFQDWLRLPNINPETIQSYYSSLKQIHLSDGSLLVKPLIGPEFDSLPPLNWRIQDWQDRLYVDILWYGNSNVGDPTNPPMRYVGGFVFYFPGSEQNQFADDFVGVTMQVLDRTKPEGYSLWTAIFPKWQLTFMHAGRITAMMNNGSQLSPFLNFHPGNKDTTWWDMMEFLRTEGWYDPEKTDQAFKDFVDGTPNDYLDSHVMLAAPGATIWISPK